MSDRPILTEAQLDEYIRKLKGPTFIVYAIDTLRGNEGASITIVSSNREGCGPDNELIEVCDDWTDWEDRRFKGTTLAECFTKALAAMPDRCKPQTAITGSTGTFVPLDGPLPDFIQGPPISRVCAPPVEAASLVPPGGNSRTITRGGEIEALVILGNSGEGIRTIMIETATPSEIMEVYAHLKYEVEYAMATFRRFGGIAAKAYAELGGDQGRDARSLMRSLNIPLAPSADGCAHLRAIEQTLQGVVVTGRFYCPDCGRVLPSV